MPTIKDVARLAGVSHGTVSNILNGYKSVNSDIVKRVERAIKELGYQPNVKARSLRSSKTSCIGVLLPCITDSIYSRIYKGIERIASEAGYSLCLYTTNDSFETEHKLLMRMQQQRLDGAVIVTCMPEKTEVFEQLINSGIKLAFVRRKPLGACNAAFFGIDEKRAVNGITQRLLDSGCKDVALVMGRKKFSNESDCLEGFREAFSKRGLPMGAVKVSDAGMESAFCTAALWLQNGDVPEAVVTTCPEFAAGIETCVRMFGPAEPRLVTLDDEGWVEKLLPSGITHAEQRFLQLGEAAARGLLKQIKLNSPSEDVTLNALPARDPRMGHVKDSKRFKGGKLRVLLLESAPSHASEIMKTMFTGQTGIDVEIDALPYEQMYNNSIGNLNEGGYDVMQVNIPWLNEAVRSGVIISLDEHIAKGDPVLSAFPREVLRQHAMYDNRLYALPYMFGVQLLFYRKDIFNDLRIQRLYFERNKSPLKVPDTWAEYDKAAEFFTREFNPDSPVDYGTTLCGPGNIYYYMLRLWEAGGNIFAPDGKVNSPSAEAVEALRQYAGAFRFADPDALTWAQAEQATQFCNGNAAMMVIFQAHFSDHVYRRSSLLGNENIGFAPVPGKTSVLGGWSLCVCEKSRRREEALTFAKWFCEEDKTVPYNLLGGSMPNKTAFESIVMKEKYPWLPEAFLWFKHSRRFFDDPTGRMSLWKFEQVANGVLINSLSGLVSPQNALETLREALLDAYSQK